jgi:hypothetical protein
MSTLAAAMPCWRSFGGYGESKRGIDAEAIWRL